MSHDSVSLKELKATGKHLNRPECVLAHRSGYLFTSSWEGNGGVSIIAPNGDTRTLLNQSDTILRPNGIALEADGNFLLAHLGEKVGGLYRLFPDGQVEPVLTHMGAMPIPPSNFPVKDQSGRIWLSISTTVMPRAVDYRKHANTGFIILIDKNGARVVADQLGYANEVVISPDQQYLYVNETFARRLSRFTITPHGALTNREVVAEFEAGDFPDGLILDSESNFWVTSIVSNRVIKIDQKGNRHVVLEDADAEHLEMVERAWREDEMGRPHLDNAQSKLLGNISSLAFGGDGMRTAYLGSLLGKEIYQFDAGISGIVPVHYDADISIHLRR
ncbi:SMP-30/gluconolactonase/LRE family protein (plasmid) [Pantoea sp. C3]|uniref:SMP-30/gluconolactonase/LRE family protein n=1 Tax=Pantoea phytostimulans TaxID=2769024 RepID=UPI0038F7B893